MTLLEKALDRAPVGERTKQIYLKAVMSFIEYAGPSADCWTAAAADAWLRRIRRKYGPSTRQLYVIGLRLASRLYAEGVESRRDFASGLAVPKVDRPKRKPGDKRRTARASEDKLDRIIAACQGGDPHAVRDRALLHLLSAGVPRADAAGVQLDDVSEDCSSVIVRRNDAPPSYAITLDDDAADAMCSWVVWLRSRRATGALFRRMAKNSYVLMGGLSANGVYAIVKSRAAQAHVRQATPRGLAKARLRGAGG